MGRIIDFFSKILIVVFIFSCKNSNSELNHQNFKTFDESNDSIIHMKSKIDINLLEELNYDVILNKKNENSLIESYFSFANNKYLMPKNFRNNGNRYEYSLFPNYTSNNATVSKSYTYKDFTLTIIRGENPFCNGFNCTSYYLHLLRIKNDKIDLNIVYSFDYKEIKFEDLEIKFLAKKNIIQIIDNGNILDEVIW